MHSPYLTRPRLVSIFSAWTSLFTLHALQPTSRHLPGGPSAPIFQPTAPSYIISTFSTQSGLPLHITLGLGCISFTAKLGPLSPHFLPPKPFPTSGPIALQILSSAPNCSVPKWHRINKRSPRSPNFITKTQTIWKRKPKPVSSLPQTYQS